MKALRAEPQKKLRPLSRMQGAVRRSLARSDQSHGQTEIDQLAARDLEIEDGGEVEIAPRTGAESAVPPNAGQGAPHREELAAVEAATEAGGGSRQPPPEEGACLAASKSGSLWNVSLFSVTFFASSLDLFVWRSHPLKRPSCTN